jgi:phage terminase small subunit
MMEFMMPTFEPNGQYRQIRVFISSTFRDMQADRDELVKRVFPQLRKLCEERAGAPVWLSRLAVEVFRNIRL